MRALKQPTYLNPHLELYKITVLLPSKWTKLAVSEYKLTGYIGPWVRGLECDERMGHRFTVAIVEDNYWAGKLLESYCQQCGLRVISIVSEGEQFIQLYDQLQPDIMLVDIGLKGNLDGITMVQSLRSAGYQQKVIMVSGTTNIDHVLTSFHDLGSLYFLSKPVMLPKFQAAIRKAIAEIQLERSQSVQAPKPRTTTWITVKNQKSELPISEDSILFIEKEDKRFDQNPSYEWSAYGIQYEFNGYTGPELSSYVQSIQRFSSQFAPCGIVCERKWIPHFEKISDSFEPYVC